MKALLVKIGRAWRVILVQAAVDNSFLVVRNYHMGQKRAVQVVEADDLHHAKQIAAILR
jgi:hypothetical protein